MSRARESAAKLVAPSGRRSLWAWAGPIVVLAALACASATFLVIASAGPIEPNSNTLILLYFADGVAIVLLLAMVLSKSLTLFRAWRSGEAAAGLHMRIVAFLALVALIPALAVAVVGTVSLERALSPVFMSNLKGFVHKTAEAAQTFRETQCGELLKEAQLTASDLDQSRAIYDADRNLYHKYLRTRARTLGFSIAALVHPNGQILDQVVGDPSAASAIVIALPPEDFQDARLGKLQCRMIDEDRTFVGLRMLTSFPDTYLYVTRPMHPFAVEFPRQAGIFINNYDAFEAFGVAVKRNFAIIYAMLMMILLLSSIWVGLDFANRLVAPIRTLIAATDEVSAGNLAVRVEVDRAHGDLSRLGAVFNKMTTELDLQQKRLSRRAASMRSAAPSPRPCLPACRRRWSASTPPAASLWSTVPPRPCCGRATPASQGASPRLFPRSRRPSPTRPMSSRARCTPSSRSSAGRASGFTASA